MSEAEETEDVRPDEPVAKDGPGDPVEGPMVEDRPAEVADGRANELVAEEADGRTNEAVR